MKDDDAILKHKIEHASKPCQKMCKRNSEILIFSMKNWAAQSATYGIENFIPY